MLDTRQATVVLGIAVVLPLLVYYAVATFYPPPNMDDYYRTRVQTRADPTAEERRIQNEEFQAAHKAFAEADGRYARILSLAAAAVSFLAILLGGNLSNATIGTGLIAGSIIMTLASAWRTWDGSEKWQVLISLLLVLVALGLVGYRKAPRWPSGPWDQG